jgi:preprotein translocase subunit SecA
VLSAPATVVAEIVDARLRHGPARAQRVRRRGDRAQYFLVEAFALVREAAAPRARDAATTTCSSSAAWCCTAASHRRDEDRRRQDPRRHAALYLNALRARACTSSRSTTTWPSRDAEWMGRIYKFLGLSVGVIVHGLPTTSSAGLPLRHHLRHEQRVRLRLPARQHEVRSSRSTCSAAQLRHRRRGRLDPHRRGAHAAHHLGPGRGVRDSTTVDQIIPSLASSATRTEHRRRGRLHHSEKATTLTESGVEKVEKLLGLRQPLRPAEHRAAPPRQAGAARAHALQARRGTTSSRTARSSSSTSSPGRLMPGRRWSTACTRRSRPRRA